jgi:hypothetical protein
VSVWVNRAQPKVQIAIYRPWQSNDHRNCNHFLVESREYETKRLTCKTVGTARFILDAPDLVGSDPPAPVSTAGMAPMVPGTQQQTADGAGAAAAPPWLPYAPNPGTYTQLWMSKSAGTSAAEMAAECEAYIETFSGTPVDYNAIITSLLVASDGMVFLTLLAGNQGCTVHLMGRFSCGLGKHTPSHNHIFGLLGEKVGEQLPPVAMVPAGGLAPWFQLEDKHQPTTADLAELETSANNRTVLEPTMAGN